MDIQQAHGIESDVNYLQCYGQPVPHAPARLIGTAPALEALKNAVERALSSPGGQGQVCCFTSDGEGYMLEVLRVDERTLFQAPTPYSAEEFVDLRPDRLDIDALAVARERRKI